MLERNGERAVVEWRSGLPYCVGVGCVFGRDQRLITRRANISVVAVVSSADVENGHLDSLDVLFVDVQVITFRLKYYV